MLKPPNWYCLLRWERRSLKLPNVCWSWLLGKRCMAGLGDRWSSYIKKIGIERGRHPKQEIRIQKFTNLLIFFFFFFIGVHFQIITVGSYVVAHAFFSVCNMAIDTIFLCFCKYSARKKSMFTWLPICTITIQTWSFRVVVYQKIPKVFVVKKERTCRSTCLIASNAFHVWCSKSVKNQIWDSTFNFTIVNIRLDTQHPSLPMTTSNSDTQHSTLLLSTSD